MRYSLVFLILFYSQIFSQSTIFIKYSTYEAAKNISAKVSSDLTKRMNSTDQLNSFKVDLLFNSYGSLNSDLDRIVKYEFKNLEDFENFKADLFANPNIEYYQEIKSYQIDNIPSDSLYPQQWGLKSINAPTAWDLIPPDQEDIILAVIDTGIDYLHPDLDDIIFKNDGEIGIDFNGNDKSSNNIDDDQNGFIDDYYGWDFVDKQDIFPAEIENDFTVWDNNPMDEHGHGTNISGIIAAEHNNIGIAGANPNVKILNLRAFDKNGTGEEDDAASAIIYAVKMGAKIINMSWGDSQYSNLLKDVIQYAYENGVVLVASSGNNSTDTPHYPSGFSNVISVGSIQENGARSSFSNYGSSLDLVAPGSQIITTRLNGSYQFVSGTSASAPFVSAAAALLKTSNEFGIEEIKQILKSTSTDLGENGWDEFFGAGNLNMEKALQILSPSTIKFNSPTQDYFTQSDSLIINITCLSPYFKNYELFYGTGVSPNSWQSIKTGKESFQLYNEQVSVLNTSNFSDTSYTLRLLVNRIDGKTDEERVIFGVDRTPPKIIGYNLTPVILNDIETAQASILTDDLTTAQLYYRRINSTQEFNSIFLDGFNTEIKNVSDNHFGLLPTKEVLGGLDHEFYISVTNQSGLTTLLKDQSDYFTISSSINNNIISSYLKEYSLPGGRIFKSPIKFPQNDENFILLNTNENSTDISIYGLNANDFSKVGELKNKIPIDAGDYNSDGKIEILNLFVKNGYIDTQSELGAFSFENKFTDTTQTFWPAYADDLDGDEKIEIITFSSDTSITIWEVNANLDLRFEKKLSINSNFRIGKSTFRNNQVLVDNFDDDAQIEIVCLDNYGRLHMFEISGTDNYSFEKTVEYFEPTELKSTISKGDYNGDGKIDIGLVLNFEENVFLTPLTYCAVINLSAPEINFLFENMFLSTESNFIGSFEKQYYSIDFSDVNNNGSQDLILFTFPNSYIFEYSDNSANQLFYQTNVNSQSIFIGDIDNNGIDEIGIPNGDKIFFNEFVDDGLISPPIITDYYSLDNERIYFEWETNLSPVYIYKHLENENFTLYDSTSANIYIDSVNSLTNYYYTFQYYDINNHAPISLKSSPIKVFSHTPGKITDLLVLNSKNIEISFSYPITKDNLKIESFLFNENEFANSVAFKNQEQIIVNLTNDLKEGSNQLFIKGIRDIYNTPIRDTLIEFNVLQNNNLDEFLFISNYEIIDNYNLVITYNFNLDTLTSLNIDNYSFRPNNTLEHLTFYNNDPKSVLITTQKPFGSIGREYILKINDVLSSPETGFLPISKFSGSEIVLSAPAENLDDIYVYPNPVNSNSNSALTFANLPPRVNIYIYTVDGTFVKYLTEDDGNGGLDWNLLNSNDQNISSGIYIYRAISMDNFNNKLQEKIGKFAVIK